MVYASANFFIKVYINAQTTQQSAGMTWSLVGNLLHEIESSQVLTCSASDSLLVCIMPTDDTIQYQCKMKYLIRIQDRRIDTVFPVCLGLYFSYNGLFVCKGITDHIEIKFPYKQSSQILKFEKFYTPEVLFNHYNYLNSIAP